MDLSELLSLPSSGDGLISHGVLKDKLSAINESFDRNEANLENFIIGLGTALTSTKLEERLKGIVILGTFIELQYPPRFTDQEIDYICEFLLARLKDHHSFIPIIVKTLLHLARAFNLTDKQALIIFHAINKEISAQQLPIQERFLLYQLIGKLFTNHTEAFKSINNDFLYGFIQLIEGERDPRCLILCFNLFTEVVSNLTLGHLDEEVFDVVSCYFPISYSPTKDKGIHISRDDLHEGLKRCFMASPSFAPYAFNLFIEKLESEVESAKIDSYDMISSCSPVYGEHAVNPFLMSIWTAIRIDILRMTSGKVNEKATEAMIAILLTIEKNREVTRKFIKDVFQDMEAALTKVSIGLMRPASQFFSIISTCSHFYMKSIAMEVFPLFMKNLIFDESNQPREFLEGFTRFFCSWKDRGPNPLMEKCPDQEILLLHLISLFDACENHIRLASLECILNFVQCSFTWDQREEVALARGLLYLILEENHSDERIRSKAKEVISFFGKKHLLVTQNEITQKLLDKLPDPSNLASENWDRLFKILSALKHCLSDSDLNGPKLENLVKIGSTLLSTAWSEKENSKQVEKVVVECLTLSITPTNYALFDELFLAPLLNPETVDLKSISIHSEGHRKELLSHILRVIPTSRKTLILQSFLNIVENRKKSDLSNPDETKNLFKAIECILCCTSLNFEFPWTEFIHNLLSLACPLENEEITLLMATIVEITLNKVPSEVLPTLANQLKTILQQLNTDSKSSKFAIQGMISANRSLVIRGQEMCHLFTKDLLSVIETHADEEIVHIYAKNFVPSHSDYSYYNNETGSIISPFYAQKHFSETFQPLLKGYNDSSGWRKRAFALCLLNHLKNLPKTVIRDEINKLQSLVIFNLEETDAPDNQSTALDCLMQLIEANSPSLYRNLFGIISRLLVLGKDSVNLEIRRKSLECLASMAKSMNEISLLPHRPFVLQSLKVVLDDKKRIVRYACSSAQHHWVLLGQPV